MPELLPVSACELGEDEKAVMNIDVNFMNNSYLLVDTGVIADNARQILSSLSDGTQLIPVLKGDAYGLGIIPVARALCCIDEIKCFAVAHVSEGLELRRAGIGHDILVMGNFLPHQAYAAVEAGLMQTCGRADMVDMVAKHAAALNTKAKIQVKLDTGLHRIGVVPGAELEELIGRIKVAGDLIEVCGAFTHFANLDDLERTAAQYDLFITGVKQLEKAGIKVPMRHVSSSAISELHPEYDLDAVRIGRRLYMDHPTSPLGNIREAASWRSYVTDVKQRRAGDSLGYGGKFHLDADTVVATVGVGYGDGLNQALVAAHAPVLVGGKLCRLLACCMDQCFVDVSGIDCRPDDEVTFFGYDSAGNFLSSQQVALMAGDDEGCGLTSALNARVARVYK